MSNFGNLKKYYFSFGSGQLNEFNIPDFQKDRTLVVIEAEKESIAREQIFSSIIEGKFCTSYDDIPFKTEWIYTLDELMTKLKKEYKKDTDEN